jgi:hypothetical protein
MKIRVERQIFDDESTLGQLLIDGVEECFVLEDKVREVPNEPVESWKIPHLTAIPYGVYKLIINHSQRFNRDLPLLLNVPGFSGVRIHPGNTSVDTEGCLVVGRRRGEDFVGESRAAFGLLYPKIVAAINAGDEVTVEIAKAEGYLEKNPTGDV